VRAELVAGLELSERLLELARQKNDPLWIVEAHYARGIMHSWRGDFKEAREHLELAARDYRPERHRAHLALYGQDPGPICLCRGAAVLWHVGYPDQALARMEDALGLVEELAHPFSRAYVLTWTAALRILRREVAEAAVWIDRALMFATEQAYPFWTAWATAQRGWLSAQQGQSDQAIAQLEDGLSQMRAVGTEVTQASVMGWMGEALASLGRTSDALRLIEQALDKVDRNRERWGEAELLRLRGVVLLAAIRERPRVHADKQSRGLGSKMPSPGNCEPPSVLLISGAIRAGARRLVTSSRRSMAGSPRASIPLICRTPRRCSTSSVDFRSWLKPCRPTAPRHDGLRAQTGQAGSDFRFPAVCFVFGGTCAVPETEQRWFGCWDPAVRKRDTG
jgi:tetratricopeptide (TPR) repeat protein